MADAAGVQLDVDLIGTWVRDFDLVDRQGFTVFDVDCCFASHVFALLAPHRALINRLRVSRCHK
ncbi:MAG: hypothetical protein F4180_09945 [Chloroflexi bacterium]|nr:hypothetical protein [Chloroflexota bacterium]